MALRPIQQPVQRGRVSFLAEKVAGDWRFHPALSSAEVAERGSSMADYRVEFTFTNEEMWAGEQNVVEDITAGIREGSNCAKRLP